MADVAGSELVGVIEDFASASQGGFVGAIVALSSGDPDVTNPVVDNYSPAIGSTLNEADPIFFDVTDNSGQFASIIIAIKQGDATEVVHDGTDFLEPYDDLSGRSNIAEGFRYRIRRSGGWVDRVVQSAFVVDAAGNVAA
jgi:hypothetical protein